jgi:hypothetical protein
MRSSIASSATSSGLGFRWTWARSRPPCRAASVARARSSGSALLLARRGAHVLVSGRDAERGDAVVAEIRTAGGKADFVAADLGDAG